MIFCACVLIPQVPANVIKCLQPKLQVVKKYLPCVFISRAVANVIRLFTAVSYEFS